MPNLYCVHAAMGTVVDYARIARSLRDARNVYGINCRMLYDLNHVDVSLEQMASDYVDMLRSHQPQGPYELVGWSLGGLLAAMMAHRFEFMGERVTFLGLIDPYVPIREREDGEDWNARFLAQLKTLLPDIEAYTLLPLETGDPCVDEAAVLSTLKKTEEHTGCRLTANSVATLDELARIFVTGRMIHRAMQRSAETFPSKLIVPVHSWWTKSRPIPVVDAAIAQMNGCDIHIGWIGADHEQIVGHESLIADLSIVLSSKQD